MQSENTVEVTGPYVLTTKYKRPLEVIMWDEFPQMPKCCWFCNHFDRKTAMCNQYNQVVPEDYAAKKDACPAFDGNIPF